MTHSEATVMMKGTRELSEFPRIDMPSSSAELPSPRFGRLSPPTHGPAQHLFSRIVDLAKHTFPAILILSVFICFFLAAAAIWTAAFRH
ncbi:MAG TPA: hypothetical protein VI251_06010 [Pseudolabrys sp.]|jgi:hypothetical protein